ncbi:hypothetical protein [Gordonia cholesterolivorans]|uniref:Knr4/Smi1-like domain-containing protein n=1 Tax=Gordonia cholesterolivorans TaxID=559625 RepID=A0ABP5UG64_9ACTN
MTDVPDWASDALRRTWPTLTEDDRQALIADRENSLLRTAAVQLRGTDLDRSEHGGDFTLDGLYERGIRWHAEAFGEPWNGWATPIVTAATAKNMFADLLELGEADGPLGAITDDGLLVYGEDEDDNFVIAPNDRGEFALWELGWTFLKYP